MTNRAADSRSKPAVGHAAHRHRDIGYPKSVLPLDPRDSPAIVTADPRRADRGVHGGIVH